MLCVCVRVRVQNNLWTGLQWKARVCVYTCAAIFFKAASENMGLYYCLDCTYIFVLVHTYIGCVVASVSFLEGLGGPWFPLHTLEITVMFIMSYYHIASWVCLCGRKTKLITSPPATSIGGGSGAGVDQFSLLGFCLSCFKIKQGALLWLTWPWGWRMSFALKFIPSEGHVLVTCRSPQTLLGERVGCLKKHPKNALKLFLTCVHSN